MATLVTPSNPTVAGIRSEVRDYVGISSASILPDSTIDQELNYFYTANIPESIKMDQLRTVYTVYTLPYVDRYPVDVNKYQSLRDPVLVDGLRARFMKDRGLFYSSWPNVRTYLQPAYGDGVTTSFTFTLRGIPIAPTTFMCSVPDISGYELIGADDGGRQSIQGNILQVIRNSVGNYTPPFPDLSPLPPTPLPNPPYSNIIGTIDYVSGVVNLNFPTPPAAGAAIRVNFFCYSPGRPNTVLYWNNELIIRPIGKYSHKIDMEAYMTPLEFLSSTDTPFLNNFKRYLSLGVAMNILRKLGDTQKKQDLEADFNLEQTKVLERQANEEMNEYSPMDMLHGGMSF